MLRDPRFQRDSVEAPLATDLARWNPSPSRKTSQCSLAYAQQVGRLRDGQDGRGVHIFAYLRNEGIEPDVSVNCADLALGHMLVGSQSGVESKRRATTSSVLQM